MTIQELRKKIESDKKKYGQIAIMNGAFGDINEQCTGLVELPIIYPETGGTFTKFYGCSYLFSGNPSVSITREIGLAKAMLSAIPREIIMQSFLLKSALGIMYLFFPKRFYYYLWIYSDILLRQTFVSEIIPYERRNEFTKELERALEWSLNFNGYSDLKDENDRDLGDTIKNFGKFIYFFLEKDCAYRFPAQDILILFLISELKINYKKEINRVFDILKDRADKDNLLLLRKFEGLRKIMLILPKDLRKIFIDFLLVLNLEKVKLSEADWYFCLQRKYKYCGISLEERIKVKDKIDKEKGHIILEFNKKVA